ncbi:leucine-rich repeat domain-containing protein [Mariniblastus sp.]|nr:leucine-rich repeat domain-containing protein [Mariniblastus sp.]MDC0294540.1 leucine-rich repeat domain-containing protein [Mariniblastus sp.]
MELSSDEKQLPKPKRRWFQLSLRTLLFLVMLASTVPGWVGLEWAQRRREKLAIGWVAEMGGNVQFNSQKWRGNRAVKVAIRKEKNILALDYPPSFNLLDIEVLGAPLSGLFPLEELKILTNLQRFLSLLIDLYFDNNRQLVDLSPLSDLKSLEELRIWNTPVADLSPLATLKRFEAIEFFNAPVRDLSPLAGLSRLKELQIIIAPVSDLSPLSALKNLEYLDFYDTNVSDLTPLRGLKNLKKLDLNATKVRDLSPLAELKNLEYLDLRNTQIRDLSPLADLKSLEYLDLRNTYVRDFSPLVELNNLQELFVNKMQAPTTPLALLKRYLKLDGTRVTKEQLDELELKLPNCKIYR